MPLFAFTMYKPIDKAGIHVFKAVNRQNGFCLGRENSGSPDETSPVHFT